MSADDYMDDPENQAIFSLIAGIAALLLIWLGLGTILEPLGVIGGFAAVSAGVRVLRGAAANKKLAVTGTVTGTIAVTVWVISLVYRFAMWAFGVLF